MRAALLFIAVIFLLAAWKGDQLTGGTLLWVSAIIVASFLLLGRRVRR